MKTAFCLVMLMMVGGIAGIGISGFFMLPFPIIVWAIVGAVFNLAIGWIFDGDDV